MGVPLLKSLIPMSRNIFSGDAFTISSNLANSESIISTYTR